MKNNLRELNNYLFEELERLNDDEELCNDEKLERELKRSKAITEVSSQIVQNAKVILDAKKHADQFGFKMDSLYGNDNKNKLTNKDVYEEFGKTV